MKFQETYKFVDGENTMEKEYSLLFTQNSKTAHVERPEPLFCLSHEVMFE